MSKLELKSCANCIHYEQRKRQTKRGQCLINCVVITDTITGISAPLYFLPRPHYVCDSHVQDLSKMDFRTLSIAGSE